MYRSTRAIEVGLEDDIRASMEGLGFRVKGVGVPHDEWNKRVAVGGTHACMYAWPTVCANLGQWLRSMRACMHAHALFCWHSCRIIPVRKPVHYDGNLHCITIQHGISSR